MRYSKLIKKALTISAAATILASSSLAADYTDPTTKMEFVKISGGSFNMGDQNRQDKYALPVHEVTVADFYMGVYEVTFEQYDKFCKETNRPAPDDEEWGRGQQPVINVDWNDAVAFTKWLSKKSGKTFRLPSEAEWEYAARAETFSNYPWGYKIASGNANCVTCGSQYDGKSTAPVGSFKPNNFGLYDMVGNVYEWTADSFSEDYSNAPADGAIVTIEGEDTQMVRGGSWNYPPIEATVFRRCWYGATTKNNLTGFRVVMIP